MYRLIETTQKLYGQPIYTIYYEYDKQGNRTKRADDPTSPSKTLTYDYDNIYQIAEVYHVEGPAVPEEFTYDDVGNRTSDSDHNDYTYNANNQLTTYDSGDIDLYYDKNGNLTKKTETGVGDTEYSYDIANRLVRIDYPDSDYSTYKYDALGRRIEKRDKDGVITQYYYDGFDMVASYDDSNELVSRVTFGPGIDNPISLHHDGDVYNYHTDALGTVTEMTDDTETVVQSYEYSAFGQILSQPDDDLTTVNPFTYTAREHDIDSGLYYYRARYYDAEVGRFLSRDPIGFEGGINLYAYVGNSPVNYTDPTGQSITGVVIIIGVGAFLIGLAKGFDCVSEMFNCDDDTKAHCADLCPAKARLKCFNDLPSCKEMKKKCGGVATSPPNPGK